jgi:uncharacterized protein (TIGR02145 family)
LVCVIDNIKKSVKISEVMILLLSILLVASCEKDNTTVPVSEILFNPDLIYGTLKDVDGNTYQTITIGTQIWMAENLKTTRYNDGTVIPLITSNPAWSNLSIGALCWHENDISNKSIYGALYNGYAVNTNKLCPSGWHVPTIEEWHTLILNFDSNALSSGILNSPVGGNLKEISTNHWLSSNIGATNISGFTALPGDFRNAAGSFGMIGGYSFFWSATASATKNLWGFWLSNHSEFIYWGGGYITCGLSIRCVED